MNAAIEPRPTGRVSRPGGSRVFAVPGRLQSILASWVTAIAELAITADRGGVTRSVGSAPGRPADPQRSWLPYLSVPALCVGSWVGERQRPAWRRKRRVLVGTPDPRRVVILASLPVAWFFGVVAMPQVFAVA